MVASAAVIAAFPTGAGGAAASPAGTAGATPAMPDRPLALGQHATSPRPLADDDGDGIRRIMPNPILRDVLSGEDEDDGADDPALSALCQTFLGQPSPYRDPAPNVDMINGDGTNPTGSQTGCSSPQNETTIAVNPSDPRNLVAGANDYRLFNARENGNDATAFAYTSFDGGRTWTDVTLPGLDLQTGATGELSDMDSAGDPAIAFGPNGTVYYVTLVFSRLNAASGVAVNVSHDGGLHWDAPTIIHTDGVNPAGKPLDTPIFNDKPWIAADPRSGRVYVTWTRFEDDADGNYLQSPIVISASTDFGRTWSAERPVGPTLDTFTTGITPFAQGSNPKVAPDGSLYVAWETSVCDSAACDQPTDHDATVIGHSRDGGRTFSLTEIAPNFDFPFDPDSGGGLTGENFRLNSFPQLDIDRVTGRLWITWADDRNGRYDEDGNSVRTNGDAIVASSGDGRHWSLTTAGSKADEVFPAVAAFAGRVAVTFFTRAFDAQGIGIDYAYVSGLGTGHLSGLHRITGQSEDPRVQFVSQDPDTGEVFQGVFVGDYSAVAMGTDLAIHPCWTDFRGRPGTNTPNQDAYTQSIRLG